VNIEENTSNTFCWFVCLSEEKCCS